MATIINLYGGPGAGKSTLSAGIFSLLKLQGINCELVTEFAKDLTWEKRHHTLKNQAYIFGKQFHRLWRLKDEVEVIITDSPLLLSLYYDTEKSENFRNYVMEQYHKFNNWNYVVKRKKTYNPKGRNQTENEAKEIDLDIIKFLDKEDVGYTTVEGNAKGINEITKDVINIIGHETPLSNMIYCCGGYVTTYKEK